MAATTDPRLEYLFMRYFEGTCTRKEKDELLELISLARYDDQLKQLMDQVWTRLSSAYRLNDKQSERILSGIFPSSSRVSPARISGRLIIKWSAAAAVLLLLLAAWRIWRQDGITRKSMQPSVTVTQLKHDIAPGGNKAMLILSNGSAVVLDSARNGVVAQQGSAQVSKLNGRLSYNSSGREPAAVTLYNTIVTPRGGQYQVVLPDSSRVWLNAASSLRFPTRFSGKERVVELTGEAYFEVAANKDMPFKVKAGGMEVKVLGTHFDVMAYDDEPTIRTTLLKGAVEVAGNSKRVKLVPGQQASLSRSGDENIRVEAADMQSAVAWKNGLFLFHDTDIRFVLRQIARWYNTDVTYDGEVNARLNGMVSRNTDLSKVLHMLELTSEVRFSIEDKKIIITPGK